MLRYLTLMALFAALLIGSVAVAAHAVGAPPAPPGWEIATRGLAPEPPGHVLLGPISAAGRKAWDCWPQLEAESATLDPVFQGQPAGESPRP
ncbi:hypothetical protein EPN44_08800 [bacterium]|nr:MAG: hypothetical protein EPN44_08800 [bacterium]